MFDDSIDVQKQILVLFWHSKHKHEFHPQKAKMSKYKHIIKKLITKSLTKKRTKTIVFK